MTTLAGATDADREFLYQVYVASRDLEMAQVPWSDEQKQTFLRMQFDLQDRHYRTHFPSARFQLIRLDDRPIGRLYLYETPAEIRVMDIALLPAFRGGGIGSALLRDIQRRAAESGQSVTLHVEHTNPARRLYERLGFRVVADEGMYLRMQWRFGQNA